MILTKQDFLIKAGLLIAAAAVSNLHWSTALNPAEPALFHLGSLLAVVTLLPIVTVIPGILFFGISTLVIDKRTRDHTRACFLMGLYVVVLWIVCWKVTEIVGIQRPSSAKEESSHFWYFAYVFAFIYSLPGIDFGITSAKPTDKTQSGDERTQEKKTTGSVSDSSAPKEASPEHTKGRCPRCGGPLEGDVCWSCGARK